jgi:hypothetical protein
MNSKKEVTVGLFDDDDMEGIGGFSFPAPPKEEGPVVVDLPPMILRWARPTGKLPEMNLPVPRELSMVPVERVTRPKKRPWWKFWQQ